MKKEHIETRSDISTLIKICNDGAEGYRKAAEKIEKSTTKSLLEKIANERTSYSDKLERESRVIFGNEVGDTNTISGELHQVWMEVKATFSGNTEKALLQECIRGEKAALEVYRNVIDKDNLPLKLMDIATFQFKEIINSLRKMEILEDAADGEKSDVFLAPNQKGEPRERVL